MWCGSREKSEQLEGFASAVSNGAIYQDVKDTRVGGVDLCGGGSNCISFLQLL